MLQFQGMASVSCLYLNAYKGLSSVSAQCDAIKSVAFALTGRYIIPLNIKPVSYSPGNPQKLWRSLWYTHKLLDQACIIRWKSWRFFQKKPTVHKIFFPGNVYIKKEFQIWRRRGVHKLIFFKWICCLFLIGSPELYQYLIWCSILWVGYMPESVLYLRTSSYMAAPLMFSAVTTTKKMTD